VHKLAIVVLDAGLAAGSLAAVRLVEAEALEISADTEASFSKARAGNMCV